MSRQFAEKQSYTTAGKPTHHTQRQVREQRLVQGELVSARPTRHAGIRRVPVFPQSLGRGAQTLGDQAAVRAADDMYPRDLLGL